MKVILIKVLISNQHFFQLRFVWYLKVKNLFRKPINRIIDIFYRRINLSRQCSRRNKTCIVRFFAGRYKIHDKILSLTKKGKISIGNDNDDCITVFPQNENHVWSREDGINCCPVYKTRTRRSIACGGILESSIPRTQQYIFSSIALSKKG